MKLLKSAPNNRRHAHGFTLIELMIVVTLIGVLSSIAVTSYIGYTRAADRAEVQGNVYELAQIMERSYTEDQDYRTASLITDTTPTGVLATFNRDNPKYIFTVDAPVANQFVVEAEAQDESRDDFDIRIDHRGTEEYRADGSAIWERGWDQIP